MILPPCAPESISVRELRLAPCPDNCSTCCTSLRMSAGAMLLRTGSQSVLVHRTAPVMVLMVFFSCTSTRLLCAEFLQTGAQYSATEYKRANTDVRRVFAPAPRVVQPSMCTKLLRVRVFGATFVRWVL